MDKRVMDADGSGCVWRRLKTFGWRIQAYLYMYAFCLKRACKNIIIIFPHYIVL